MKTVCISVKKKGWESEAGEVLSQGGLVAFPTETVYGLGANALDPEAVSGIFMAKGRPSDNPLIVHIADMKMLKLLVKIIPAVAVKLMNEFWPGPLTLLFVRKRVVPDIVTAGLETVAIRFPKNVFALQLIRAARVPLAAPSANLSGSPSPTCARHVRDDLDGRIDMIVDGGACAVGLESTVIDCTVRPPCILRPGAVTYEQISKCIGDVDVHPSVHGASHELLGMSEKVKSPGMKYVHYSPKAKVILVCGADVAVKKEIERRCGELQSDAKKDGNKKCTIIERTLGIQGAKRVSGSVAKYASQMFYLLRECDHAGVEFIFVQGVKERGIGLALMNRLKKAAFEVVCV